MSASTTDPAPSTNPNLSLSLDLHPSPEVRKRAFAITNNDRSSMMLAEGTTKSIPYDKAVLSGLDKHTVRGDPHIENLKISSVGRKDSSTSPAVPVRRHRTPKPGKQRWQIALNVTVKAFLLVVAILWIGQSIMKWQNGEYIFTSLDIESQINEMEVFKEKARSLQGQIDILDKRIGNEIEKARRDLIRKVEDGGTNLDVKVNKLEGRTVKLEKASADLISAGFVSRKEFDAFLSELKQTKGLDKSDDVSLEDIRQFAKEIVEREIDRHAADGIGRPDYALASGGARVIRHSEPYTKPTSWLSGVKVRSDIHPTSHKMLEPSFGEPGQCFALKGTSGFVEIKLRTAIVPEAVTLEHVSKGAAYDRSSAPKDCHVTAWYQGRADDPTPFDGTVLTLAEFSYDLEKSNIQTFPIDGTEARAVDVVRLDVSSNHGKPTHTCIYRFRVHGRELASGNVLELRA